jgi:glycine cleavage system regulatory protein
VRTPLVLTLIGRDRPGLVEALAAQVAGAGGNWEQSRMARLAGHFAGILRVSVDSAALAELRRALSSLEREGLRVVVETADPADEPRRATQMRLALVGSDRPGIVRDISRVLAARSVNVDELETTCEDAPMGGGQLFRATALLHVPAEVAPSELRSTLEGMADDLMVELTLDAVADVQTR